MDGEFFQWRWLLRPGGCFGFGQTEDWFERTSSFSFHGGHDRLVFAIVGMAPSRSVVESLLATEILLWPTFSILFSDLRCMIDILIPQMCSDCFGYTATDAGLVLGPGAFVIGCCAGGGKNTAQDWVKWLIGFGYFVFALAMWYYASFTLATTIVTKRGRERCKVGIATLFVPVSQLAYSNLPKHKNNKASSLTNLFRNQGGSFGIAFVTTVLARRTQYHQKRIGGAQYAIRCGIPELLGNLTGYFTTHGFAHADAIVHAQAQAFQLLSDRLRTWHSLIASERWGGLCC